jgi:hypothetical protein
VVTAARVHAGGEAGPLPTHEARLGVARDLWRWCPYVHWMRSEHSEPITESKGGALVRTVDLSNVSGMGPLTSIILGPPGPAPPTPQPMAVNRALHNNANLSKKGRHALR